MLLLTDKHLLIVIINRYNRYGIAIYFTPYTDIAAIYFTLICVYTHLCLYQSVTYCILRGRMKGFNCSITTILCQVFATRLGSQPFLLHQSPPCMGGGDLPDMCTWARGPQARGWGCMLPWQWDIRNISLPVAMTMGYIWSVFLFTPIYTNSHHSHIHSYLFFCFYHIVSHSCPLLWQWDISDLFFSLHQFTPIHTIHTFTLICFSVSTILCHILSVHLHLSYSVYTVLSNHSHQSPPYSFLFTPIYTNSHHSHIHSYLFFCFYHIVSHSNLFFLSTYTYLCLSFFSYLLSVLCSHSLIWHFASDFHQFASSVGASPSPLCSWVDWGNVTEVSCTRKEQQWWMGITGHWTWDLVIIRAMLQPLDCCCYPC